MKRFASSIAGLLLFASTAVADPAAEHHTEPTPADTLGYVEGASAIEGRLLAPCCWNQTLDMHGSPAATELRKEIRRRLQTGETSAAIETDIVSRYGERIRAVPPGSPLKGTAVLLSLVMAGAGVGAVFLLLRWRRRAAAAALEAAAKSKKAVRDDYDDRIDAELERM